MRPIARPLPARCGLDHLCTYGIHFDIAAQVEQVGILVDDDGLESALEHVPHDAVAPVECLRIPGVEVAHESREIRLAGMKDDMVVVAHQAVRHDRRVEPVHCLAHQLQETLSISVVDIDRFAPITTRSHVIDGSRELDAQGSCHALRLRTKPVHAARPLPGFLADSRKGIGTAHGKGAKGKT